MSNELPQGFQDLTSKTISKKAHKLVSILFTGKCAKGRIKRIRKGESKCNCYATYWMHKHRILRRIHGTSIVIPRNDHNFYEKMLTQLTRWNRH